LSFVVGSVTFYLFSFFFRRTKQISPAATHTNQPTKNKQKCGGYISVEDEVEYAMRDDTREQLGRDFPTNRIGGSLSSIKGCREEKEQEEERESSRGDAMPAPKSRQIDSNNRN
jgi:hypothetical protein